MEMKENKAEGEKNWMEIKSRINVNKFFSVIHFRNI